MRHMCLQAFGCWQSHGSRTGINCRKLPGFVVKIYFRRKITKIVPVESSLSRSNCRSLYPNQDLEAKEETLDNARTTVSVGQSYSVVAYVELQAPLWQGTSLKGASSAGEENSLIFMQHGTVSFMVGGLLFHTYIFMVVLFTGVAHFSNFGSRHFRRTLNFTLEK